MAVEPWVPAGSPITVNSDTGAGRPLVLRTGGASGILLCPDAAGDTTTHSFTVDDTGLTLGVSSSVAQTFRDERSSLTQVANGVGVLMNPTGTGGWELTPFTHDGAGNTVWGTPEPLPVYTDATLVAWHPGRFLVFTTDGGDGRYHSFQAFSTDGETITEETSGGEVWWDAYWEEDAEHTTLGHRLHTATHVGDGRFIVATRWTGYRPGWVGKAGGESGFVCHYDGLGSMTLEARETTLQQTGRSAGASQHQLAPLGDDVAAFANTGFDNIQANYKTSVSSNVYDEAAGTLTSDWLSTQSDAGSGVNIGLAVGPGVGAAGMVAHEGNGDVEVRQFDKTAGAVAYHTVGTYGTTVGWTAGATVGKYLIVTWADETARYLHAMIGPPTSMYRWDGADWQPAVFLRDDGVSPVAAPTSRWDGSAWVQVHA